MTMRDRPQNALIVGLITLGIPATALVQGGPPDAWKLVPALPANSCFADDGFDAKVQEAEQAAIAAKDRQDGMNAKVKEKFDEMPMAEKAQRMQAWMMKNPQAASKILEASADAGGGAAIAEEVQAATARLDKELEGHKSAFTTAIDRAAQPVDAKIDALIKTKTRQLQVDAVFTTDADYAAYVALINERNAAYEKACAPFFGANGAFHRWLVQHKADVTDKALAAEERGSAMMVQQMAIMDTPAGGYRSVSPYDITRAYLRQQYSITRLRKYKATPTIRLVK